MIMVAITTIGIELSARTQVVLLGAEILTLATFAVVALVKVYAGDAPAASVHPDIGWFSPFAIDSLDGLTTGLLVAVFIYWGWDSTVCVNEETTDSGTTPGRAAVASTFILVGIYVIVAAAAVAFAGPKAIAGDESGDALGLLGTQVLGVGLDKLVIIAVLTSAAASTQTTILPTARTSLSMARAGAMPASLGAIHPRFLTPHISTILMGGFSIVWYVGLTLISENILFDSIAALGLMIAFYYGLTGFACTWYYRRELATSVKAFLFVGVAPTLGGLILAWLFIKSCIDLSKPANSESGSSWLGIGPPLVIGIGFLIFGGVLMVIWYATGHRDFFRRKPEVADVGSLDAPPPAMPAPTAGVA
jgi:amino acid transporter